MTGPSVHIFLRIEVEVEQARWVAGPKARREVPQAPELAEILTVVDQSIHTPLIRDSSTAVDSKLADFPSAPSSPEHVRASIVVSFTFSLSHGFAKDGLGSPPGTGTGESIRRYIVNALNQASRFVDAGASIDVSIVDNTTDRGR